jgi:hypothetical protein
MWGRFVVKREINRLSATERAARTIVPVQRRERPIHRVVPEEKTGLHK